MIKKAEDSAEEFYSRLYRREAEKTLEKARNADSLRAFSMAEPLYKEALQLIRKSGYDVSEAENAIIDFYIRYGQLEKAVTRARKIIKRRAKGADSLSICIYAFHISGMHNEALECFNEKIETYSLDGCTIKDCISALKSLYALGKIPEALELADALDRIKPGMPLTAYIRASIYSEIYKDLHKSIKAIEAHTEEYGDSYFLTNAKGNIFLSFGWKEEALECFMNTLKMEPSHIEATEKAADLLIHFKRNLEAKSILEDFKEISYKVMEPLNCGPFYSLVGIYSAEGKIYKAAKLLDDVFEYGDSTQESKLVKLAEFLEEQADIDSNIKNRNMFFIQAARCYQRSAFSALELDDKAISSSMARKSVLCFLKAGSIRRAENFTCSYTHLANDNGLLKELNQQIDKAKSDQSKD